MTTSSSRRKISFSAESVLVAAVQDGDTSELLRVLRDQPLEVNVNQANHVGLTPLHHGVLTNNLDAVKILLGSGADVNAQDVHGFSPLHAASACGFVQLTSLLVLHGADVFLLTNDSELPVDVAKDINVIRLLSQEMLALLHRELFFSALLTRKAKECCSLLLHLLRILWESACTFVLSLKTKHRTKTD